MGSCYTLTQSSSDLSLSFILSLDPEEWTQKQVLHWLQYCCDGELCELIKPFSTQQISGLSFKTITSHDLKQIGVTQMGLIDQFLYERNKAVYHYNKRMTVTSVSHMYVQSHSSHTSQTLNTSDITLFPPEHKPLNSDVSVNSVAISMDSFNISSVSHTSSKYHIISPRRYTQRLQPLDIIPQITPLTPPTTDTPLLPRGIRTNSMYNGVCSYAIYSCFEIQQYTKHSYMECHRSVIDGYLSNSPLSFPSSVHELCSEYYFEKEIATLQIAYDIYLILRNSECIASFDSFYAHELLNDVEKMYESKYTVHREIMRCLTQLIRCGLIIKLSANVNDDVYMFRMDDLYQFNEEKRLLFEKYYDFIHDKLDRNAWRVGTKVEIYSLSLDSWQCGEIYQIDADGYLIVTYSDHVNKFKKKIHINQDDVIRSNRDFIQKRSQWDIGSNIEVFSYTQSRWRHGTIIEKLQTEMRLDASKPIQDVFGVMYYELDRGGEEKFKKYIDRWSCDIRDIEILSERLQKYEPGTAVKIYSNTKECWLHGTVKEVIPNHEMVNVLYGHNGEWEKTVHIDSNQMKLLS